MPRSIGQNAVALFAARAVVGALQFVALLLAARWLDADHFGIVVVVSTFVAVANVLTTFGSDDVIVRLVARSEPVPLGAALRLQWSLASLLGLGGVASVVADLADPLLLVGVCSLFPLGVSSIVSAGLRGLERVDLLLISAVAGAVVALAGSILAGASEAGPGAYLAAAIAGHLTAAVCGWFLFGRERRGRGVGLAQWAVLDLAQRTWRFAAMVATSGVTSQLGVFAVAGFSGRAAAGDLGLASRLLEVARLAPAAWYGARFPSLARAERSVRLRPAVVVAGLALLVGAMVAGAAAIAAWTDRGGAVLWPATWLAVGLPAILWRLHLSTGLIAADREDAVLRSGLFSLVAAVPLIVGGAAVGGAAGAAIGVSASTAAHAALLWGAARR